MYDRTPLTSVRLEQGDSDRKSLDRYYRAPDLSVRAVDWWRGDEDDDEDMTYD